MLVEKQIVLAHIKRCAYAVCSYCTLLLLHTGISFLYIHWNNKIVDIIVLCGKYDDCIDTYIIENKKLENYTRYTAQSKPMLMKVYIQTKRLEVD